MDDAQDVVRVTPNYREPRVPGGRGEADDLFRRVIGMDGCHPHPRGHDVRGAVFRETQRTVQQGRMIPVKDALQGGAADQGSEFLGAAGAGELLLGFDTERADDLVGRVVEEQNDGFEHRREEGLKRDDQLRRRQRERERKVLGNELSNHH
jgi:hypothetical protein